jgi:hypothetical protein
MGLDSKTPSGPSPEAEYPAPLLFDRLRALELTPGEYAVFGSGPIAVRGLIDTVRDLDVIVRGETWHELRSLGALVMKEGDGTIDLGNGLTFGRSWGYGSFDIDELIDDAETIEGIPFVRLNAVIEFKKIADRPKDREHLRLLRESGEM